MVGRVVEKVEARGKWMLIYFSGDLILVTHMLMSGSWHVYRMGEKWQAPRRAMRVVITCGDMQAVAFNVPVAEFHTARSLAADAGAEAGAGCAGRGVHGGAGRERACANTGGRIRRPKLEWCC